MGKEGFKQPAAAFKNSCRVYLKEKERVKALEAKYPQLAENGYDPETFRAPWSHRSAAVIANLATLGVNNLAITEKGSGGRLSGGF